MFHWFTFAILFHDIGLTNFVSNIISNCSNNSKGTKLCFLIRDDDEFSDRTTNFIQFGTSTKIKNKSVDDSCP